MEQKLKTYKAFDKDLSCRGFKYEVGKEYEETGDIGNEYMYKMPEGTEPITTKGDNAIM